MGGTLALVKKYWIGALLFLVVVLWTSMYGLGYRFDRGGFIQTGTLVIKDLPGGTSIYIDEAKLYTSSGNRKNITLRPGVHSVIVDSPDMLPWNELFEIHSGKPTEVTPLFVPSRLEPEEVSSEEREAGLEHFSETLPSKESPLMLSGGCAAVYVAGNRIVADPIESSNCKIPTYLSCVPEAQVNGVCPSTVIFPPNELIRSIIPFPGRDDALVVAAGSISFVVELDPRQPQYFAPLVRGSNLEVGRNSNESILLIDDGILYRLPL